MPGTQVQRIFPHLWYAEAADEAAHFYASIFPDSRVDRVTTLQADSPSGPPGSVKVVDFTLFGQRFQAITAGPHHEFNDAISLVVVCADQRELDRYWDALLEGGGKPQACGWLIDRFGVRWQVVPAVLETMMSDPDPARSRRVAEAFLRMVKFDIAALERAYNPMKITVETVVRAPVADVWAAWSNPEDIMQWNAAQEDWHTTRSSVDLREGGRFLSRMEAKDGSAGFDFEGVYTRVVPHRAVEYRMSDGREVEVQFVESEGGVHVTTTFDAETTNPPELQRQGWQAILDNFGRYVEAKSAAA